MSLNKAYKDKNLDLNFFRTQGLLNHPHNELDTILALMNAHVSVPAEVSFVGP